MLPVPLFVAAVAFAPPLAPRVATTAAPAKGSYVALRGNAPGSYAALRGGSGPQMLSFAQFAAGANLMTFATYGSLLVFKPGMVMKTIMRSDAPPLQFADFPYAVVQYLGAIYLSQALRMVRALTRTSMLGSDLLGAGIINTCLCLVSVARLLGGAQKDTVTLTLPVGQALMAALSFVGASTL